MSVIKWDDCTNQLWGGSWTSDHSLLTKLGFVESLHTGFQEELWFTPENTANKNANNGYAPLDSGGKIPLANLPSTLLKYIWVWNASDNTPTLLATDLTKKWNVYNVWTAWTQFSINWKLWDWAIYNDSWDIEKSDNSDDVVSVNWQTGVVVLDTSHIAEFTGYRYLSDAQKTAATREATALQNGLISSTDWNIFNNKQPAGTYLTSLSGAFLLDQATPQTIVNWALTIDRNWIATTSTPALMLINSTPATLAITVQYSPSDIKTGRAWNTTSSASNSINLRTAVRPKSGATTGGSLFWSFDNNGAGYTDIMSLSSSGFLATMGAVASPKGYLDIGSWAGFAIHIGADVNALTRTNNTDKFARFGISSYSQVLPVVAFTCYARAASTAFNFGGGTGSGYAATDINFYTAENVTTQTGTVAMSIDKFQRVGIGIAPTAVLHLKAGTATANTAPLKLTAGVNLTTEENGAFEFDGTNLFFTVGGVRKTVTLT